MYIGGVSNNHHPFWSFMSASIMHFFNTMMNILNIVIFKNVSNIDMKVCIVKSKLLPLRVITLIKNEYELLFEM